MDGPLPACLLACLPTAEASEAKRLELESAMANVQDELRGAMEAAAASQEELEAARTLASKQAAEKQTLERKASEKVDELSKKFEIKREEAMAEKAHEKQLALASLEQQLQQGSGGGGGGSEGLDVELERERIERTYAEECARVEQKLDAEQGRQKAAFQQKLAARKKQLAEKQEAQLQREAPEVAALAAKLRTMEAEKEAELEEMAAKHAAQLEAKAQAQEEAWKKKLEEKEAQRLKEERKRKAKEKKMMQATVEVSADAVDSQKQQIMARCAHGSASPVYSNCRLQPFAYCLLAGQTTQADDHGTYGISCTRCWWWCLMMLLPVIDYTGI
jgi:hypothetical protein